MGDLQTHISKCSEREQNYFFQFSSTKNFERPKLSYKDRGEESTTPLRFFARYSKNLLNWLMGCVLIFSLLLEGGGVNQTYYFYL